MDAISGETMGTLGEFSWRTRLFLKTYPWRRVDPVPWSPLRTPVSAARVALCSSAGLTAPGQEPLAAPQLMPVEVANILRRAAGAGQISRDAAALAYTGLLDLRVKLFPCASFAGRVWELRTNVTTYDAWYLALAETLGARLATLDARLSRAAGPRCEFLVPRGDVR
jgi:predicted nucleic acid-binding protein